ncbi:MAG: hypothetical protein FJX59_12655, partial [Alphaproteobacteria bacterium]|nr:hypothetical protein [Alphaproteobacteria bacterium]
MRGQIIDAIHRRMKTDANVFFMTADMGINLIEPLAAEFPDRFLNVGIAEQNMVGIAAGLANTGYRVFAYTISNFAIHRCFEQIRNDIGLHRYPVFLLGTSTGYDNAPLGPTHHIVDDWGALKTFPNFDIYCPTTKHFAATIVDRLLAAGRPAYVRIPKGDYVTPEATDDVVVLDGSKSDTLLASYGPLAHECLKVRQQRPDLAVAVFHKLNPLDREKCADVLRQFRRVIVVEDHFPMNGLYGSLSEMIASHGLGVQISSLAPRDYCYDVGVSPEYFFRRQGLDAAGILTA